MSNDIVPAYAEPVIETIKEEMEARGWTIEDVWKRLDTDVERLSIEILFALDETPHVETVIVKEGTAETLEKAFGVSKQFWMDLDANYHRWLASRKDTPDA